MTIKTYPLLPGDNVSLKSTSVGFLIHFAISLDPLDLVYDTSELVNMVKRAIDHTIISYFSSMDWKDPGQEGSENSASIMISSNLFGDMDSVMMEE